MTANLPVASRSKVDPLNVKRLQADGPHTVGVFSRRRFSGRVTILRLRLGGVCRAISRFSG